MRRFNACLQLSQENDVFRCQNKIHKNKTKQDAATLPTKLLVHNTELFLIDRRYTACMCIQMSYLTEIPIASES